MSAPKHARDIRAVIFDLDGTLADTFTLIVGAWNAGVGPITGKSYSEEEVISRFGIPDPQMIRREFGDDETLGPRADEAYHAFYEREHAALVKAFDGIDEMLSQLRALNVPLGLMTGKGRRSAGITVESLGWKDVFAAIVTGEDVKRQKPEPEGLLTVAARLNVPPSSCAFVGDSPADMGAGKSAGMIVVAAGWHPVYLDEIRSMRPDVWAEHPADVVRLIGPR
jgi:HAD superfamily hydrolase (TIGR01509 family)